MAYKKQKFNVNYREAFIQEVERGDAQHLQALNEFAELQLKQEDIDTLSKAITQFTFREGPIEGLHTRKKITQEEMKILNKHMVNRFASLLIMISEGNWYKLWKTYAEYSKGCSSWDSAEPDLTLF